jgi:hypothetical protein
MTLNTIQKRVLLAAAGVVTLGGGIWGYVAWAGSRGPEVPKELTVEALSAESENPGQLFQHMREIRDREDLTEEQRHAVFQNVRTVMESRMNERLDEYFTAPEPQRQAILDRHLNDMQTWMAEIRQQRAQREAAGQSSPGRTDSGGGSGTSGNTAGRSGSGGTASAGSGPPPGGPGAGPPPDGPGWRGDRHGPPTQAERKMRSESRDPDQMARRMAYFTALRKRAEERGIELPFPGRRPGPGPGR